MVKRRLILYVYYGLLTVQQREFVYFGISRKTLKDEKAFSVSFWRLFPTMNCANVNMYIFLPDLALMQTLNSKFFY